MGEGARGAHPQGGQEVPRYTVGGRRGEGVAEGLVRDCRVGYLDGGGEDPACPDEGDGLGVGEY